MKFYSGRGREYSVALIGTYVVLWRAVESSTEGREWPSGLVIRLVSLPYTERRDIACTCPRARFGHDGAWGCPHALPALRWLVNGGTAKGVEGVLCTLSQAASPDDGPGGCAPGRNLPTQSSSCDIVTPSIATVPIGRVTDLPQEVL